MTTILLIKAHIQEKKFHQHPDVLLKAVKRNEASGTKLPFSTEYFTYSQASPGKTGYQPGPGPNSFGSVSNESGYYPL